MDEDRQLRLRGLRAKEDQLRTLRSDLNLTQLDLAVAAGVSERTVRAAERGKRVRLASLERIAAALGVERDYLVLHESELLATEAARQRTALLFEALRTYVAEFDVGALGELLTPDALIESVGPNEVPFVGTYRGVDGLQKIRDRASKAFRFLAPTKVTEVRASGDFVLVRGVDQIEATATGRRGTPESHHLYEFERGRLVRITELLDTLAYQRLFVGDEP